MLFSLVICSCKRSDFLRNILLDILQFAPINHTQFELILVLQEYDKTEKEEIEQLTLNFPGIHIMDSKGSGLSFARNEGLHQATGKYVLYWDDDIRIGPEVFPALIHVMEQEQFDCFTAREVPIFGVTPPPWFDSSMVTQDPVGTNFYIHGSFMGMKRSILLGIGGFSSDFVGPISTKLGYGDDTYIEMHCRRKGLKLAYLREVEYHHDKTKYLNWRTLMKSAFKRGMTWSVLQIRFGKKQSGMVFKLLKNTIMTSLKFILSSTLILFSSRKYLRKSAKYFFEICNLLGGVTGVFYSHSKMRSSI